MLSDADHANFFELKYRATPDPWSASGAVSGGIYRVMSDLLRRHQSHYGHVLDVGCGNGDYTSKLIEFADRVTGIDVSKTAVARATESFKSVENAEFAAFDILSDDFDTIRPPNGFDLIVCSQVTYYYDPGQLSDLLPRLAATLAPNGTLLIVNDGSGSRYSMTEMLQMITCSFSVIESRQSGDHYLILAAPKRCSLSVTIDYEGWDDPAGCGKIGVPQVETLIDYTDRLLDATERIGGRLTLFVEVAQIDFWRQHAPGVAEAMTRQIQQAYLRGHAVELHLHPRWLTMLGAAFDAKAQQTRLAVDKGHLAALTESELRDVLTSAHDFLCTIVREVDPCYRPTAFRAGAYQIQPHELVFNVLSDLGYKFDSSVVPGAYAEQKEGIRGFDYRHAWTTHEPYVPSHADINLVAEAGARQTLLEIPIAAHGGHKLSIDTLTADQFCDQVRQSSGKHLVAIGHAKCMNPDKLAEYETILANLQDDFSFVTLEHLALSFLSSVDEGAAQHQRNVALAYYERTLPRMQTINACLTSYNRHKVDFAIDRVNELVRDREVVRVLDYGCGTGELFTLPFANLCQGDERIKITGFDVDPASILRLEAHGRRNGLSQLVSTAEQTALELNGYDLVCCLEVLEHLEDPRPVAEALARLVAPGGFLYLTIPNGYGPGELESAMKHGVKRLAVKSDLILNMALRLKRVLVSKPSESAGDRVEVAPIETLHVANNVHVQNYTRKSLRRLFAGLPLELIEQGNSAFLTGLSAKSLRLVGLSRVNDLLASAVPAPFASGWYFLFTKAAQESRASRAA